MIKKTYETLRKKYKNLPDFSRIDSEFEISTIEKKEFLLREVKRKIAEKLDIIGSVLEKMVHPDTSSLVEMVESRCFDMKERKKIFDLHKRIVILQKTLIEMEMLQDEKADADFISKLTNDWPSYRKETLPFVRKLKECWKETKEIRETLAYLG